MNTLHQSLERSWRLQCGQLSTFGKFLHNSIRPASFGLLDGFQVEASIYWRVTHAQVDPSSLS